MSRELRGRFEDLQERRQEQRPQAQVQEPPRQQPPAPSKVAQEPTRFINLTFIRAGTEQVVPWQQSLAPESTDYELRINIGALLPDRIPDERSMPPAVFPAFALPPAEEGHWLDVVTASGDFFVPLRAKARLFLPQIGSSWVCDCNPRQPHRCSPEARQQFLSIPLLTPKPGDAVLRVGIYFKNNLLQSSQVTARISPAVTREKPQSVITDYTINATLKDLQKLGSKTLNILSANIKGGGQGFIVNGDFEDLVEFHLSEGQLSTAADAARQKLRDIHMSDTTNIFGRKLVNKFDENNAKPKKGFVEDLRQIAPLGSLLWTTLFQSQPNLRQSLRDDVLHAPSTIQIARVSSNFTFPWSLVYDIPLESDPTKHIVCKIVDEWQEGTGLPLDGKYACPHEDEHVTNTLCPFGFWGLRHIIEQPPSVGEAGTLASEIRVPSPPAKLFVCASADLEKQYTAPHLADIDNRLKLKFNIEPCVTREALLARLQTVDPGVVYLYCHGGNEPLAGTNRKTPFLSVGNGEKLTPGDILARLGNAGAGLYWNLANPLIFINGCHTAELTTDVMVNFVDAFAGIYSSGVIGTEVTVHQLLANEAGAEFLQHFETETAGEALRRMRNHLLCKGNLMGLAYSAYCLSALRIADTARLTTASTVPTGH